MKHCKGCRDLADHLNAVGVDYVIVDIQKNKQAAQLMLKYQIKTVPQIFYEGQIFVRGGLRSIKTMRKNEIINRMKLIKENKNASNC